MDPEQRKFANIYTLLTRTLVVAAIAFIYRHVAVELVRTWATDDRFSHGFLIPLVAAYLAWERRERFGAAAARTDLSGLLVIGASVLLLVLGSRSADSFLSRVSLVGAMAGAALFFFGWARFRTIAFPVAILLLMIPLPPQLLNRIEAPLQLATAEIAATLIRWSHVPVLQDGNLLTLRSVTLEVAEECSGIRSLISLITLGLVFGYVRNSRGWSRVAVAAMTLPVVVVWNGIRVAVTGVAAHHYGRGAAEGFVHDLCGWIAFAAAFATMVLVHRILASFTRDYTARPPAPSVASNFFA